MRRTVPWLPALTVLAACADLRQEGEDWSTWFDDGAAYDVSEPIAFTDAPYDFPADPADGIGAFLDESFQFDRGYGTNVAPDDFTEGISGCDQWFPHESLPRRITGVVTAHPRFYFKARGCDVDDEKFYGSYWVEDATGGVFVLGDSKVAHFDMGDTVTLEVRAARRSFGLDMVYGAEVIEVDYDKRPISYVVKQQPFGEEDVGEVRRVTGRVVAGPDNFGEILLHPDGQSTECSVNRRSACVVVQLDVELNRRGVTLSAGELVTLTGPILFSYDNYSLVLTRVGQIERQVD